MIDVVPKLDISVTFVGLNELVQYRQQFFDVYLQLSIDVELSQIL